MSRDEKGGGGLLFGLVAGGIAGVAAALLFAPKAGKELRRDIKKKSDELRGSLDSQLSQDEAVEAVGNQVSQPLALVKAAAGMAGKISRDVTAGSDNDFVRALGDTISELLTHEKFMDCSPRSSRFLGHASVFYGFMGAAGTTALALIAEKVFRVKPPFRLGNPIKILGNASGLAMLAGSAVLIKERLGRENGKGSSTYNDWVLVLSIAGAASSGLLAETSRMTKVPTIAYASYFLHLVIIFFVLWYAPYSKLAHMFYRTLALTYLKMSDVDGQKLLSPQLKEIASSAEMISN